MVKHLNSHEQSKTQTSRHLGFFQEEYTPINRGFDSFLGHYNGLIDYYNYSYIEPALNDEKPGFDWRINSETNYGAKLGVYATDVYTDEATKIINNHNETVNPLFLMVNHLSPHTGLRQTFLVMNFYYN